MKKVLPLDSFALFIGAKNETELALLEQFKRLTWFCLVLVPYFVGSALFSSLRSASLVAFDGNEVFVHYGAFLAASFLFGYVYEFLMLLWLKRIALGADSHADRRIVLRVLLRAFPVWFLSFFVSLPGTLSDFAQSFLSPVLQLLLAVAALAVLYVFYRFATLKAFIVLGFRTRDAFVLSFRASAVKGYFKFVCSLVLRPLVSYLLCAVIGAMILALFANATAVTQSRLIFFVSSFSSVVVFAVLRHFPRIQLALLNYAKLFGEQEKASL